MKFIKAGTVLLFTNGAFDDFAIGGLYVACEEFEYMDKHKGYLGMTRKDFDVLISKGTLLELEHKEIWVTV